MYIQTYRTLKEPTRTSPAYLNIKHLILRTSPKVRNPYFYFSFAILHLYHLAHSTDYIYLGTYCCIVNTPQYIESFIHSFRSTPSSRTLRGRYRFTSATHHSEEILSRHYRLKFNCVIETWSPFLLLQLSHLMRGI